MSNRTRTGRLIVPIDLSQVRYNSTCISLNLPSSLSCPTCANDVCILSNKRKKRKTNERHKTVRNCCLQYWTNKWTTGSLATVSHITTHNRIRAYLGIQSDVVLEDFSFYEANDSITQSAKKRNINEDKNRYEHVGTPTGTVVGTSNPSSGLSSPRSNQPSILQRHGTAT